MAVWQASGMGSRNSVDLRERTVAAVDAGHPRSEVSALFGISLRSLDRWLARARHSESLADRPRSGRPPKIAPDQRSALAAQLTAHPDLTLAQQCAVWAGATGVRVGTSTMFREIARLNWTVQKNADRRRT